MISNEIISRKFTQFKYNKVSFPIPIQDLRQSKIMGNKKKLYNIDKIQVFVFFLKI